MFDIKDLTLSEVCQKLSMDFLTFCHYLYNETWFDDTPIDKHFAYNHYQDILKARWGKLIKQRDIRDNTEMIDGDSRNFVKTNL